MVMLSDKIKQYRKDNNLTQEEFASKLFVTRNAVSKWENNNGYPNIETIKDIAKLLEITIDELLGKDDVKTITIITNEKLYKIKECILNLMVFISYLVVAILVPDLIFTLDPTAGIAYFLIVGPISFIILGLVTPLYNKKMLHTFIASGLAIAPILIYYEMATKMVVYHWEVVFFILFIISYCVMLVIMKINLKPHINKILKWISLSLLIFLSLSYLVLCIISFITYNDSHSAPIYTQSLVYTLVFVIPIVISLLTYLIFKKKS